METKAARPPEPLPGVRRGAEVELEIDKLALGGQALGRLDNFVVFVDHGLPGQKVRARITRKRSQFAEARVVAVLRQAPEYTEPCCRHFGLCGGCQWQDLPYEAQLHWKTALVQESLAHLAKTASLELKPPVASPRVRGYRTKMEYTFAPRPWLPAAEFAAGTGPVGRPGALGLHARGSFDRIFDLEECYLPGPETVPIVREVRDWCRASGLPAYATREHRGFWRFLIIRQGQRTGETLVNLMTTDQGDPQAVAKLAAHLQERFPFITTMVHSVNKGKAQVAMGETDRLFWGQGYIEEQLLGLRFRISAQSFFQTNTEAAEALYRAVLAAADFTGREVVWDLYCGTGSIALCLAGQVEQVTGFEIVPGAVADAYVNCQLNGLENCRFLAGDLKDSMAELLLTSGRRPDVVITDPPRAGMHPKVVQALLEAAPRRIVAVSCNPATLARDLALLQEDYEIGSVQPFDLFPHTAHIECVARLERRRPAGGV